jgi:hypothetical protein
MKAKKCKNNGCDNPSWSGGLCKNHIKKTALKSTRKIPINIKKKDKKVSNSFKRYKLFMVLWHERGNRSEVSDEVIFGQPSSAHFHHILPKRKYPEADLDPDNIIIMTMDEHANVESDMYKYEEVNRRRELLTYKYN